MPHIGNSVPSPSAGTAAVASCHVERPLDDAAWERFDRLQRSRPGGFDVIALMRPPDPEHGEAEEPWLERARAATARAPFGLHTHWPPRAGATPSSPRARCSDAAPSGSEQGGQYNGRFVATKPLVGSGSGDGARPEQTPGAADIRSVPVLPSRVQARALARRAFSAATLVVIDLSGLAGSLYLALILRELYYG